MTRGAATAWIAAALALVLYCALNLRVGTNLTHFMPDGAGSELAEVSGLLTDSHFTRTMVVSIEGDRLESAIEAATELAAALRDHPQVAWVRSGVDDSQLERVFELYFPRRLYFLSDEPDRELPARFDDAALRALARQLKADLASPASSLLTQIAADDPISSFRTIVERLRQGESSLEMRSGQFVTRTGRFAILMLGTRDSAFESGVQGQLLTDIDDRFAEIAARIGEGLKLESSGANRFAVAAERSVKRDVYAIGACSFAAVALLFGLFIGGWRSFAIVSVPPLAGILVATAASLAILGGLDGLTMAFGASLMGIAIDYSNHVLIHHRLGPTGESAEATMRRIRPSLTLGAATTIASFGGLAVTAFPAFREMSFFAAIGVGAALVASLLPLPALIRYAPALPARSSALAVRLEGWLGEIERGGRRWAWLPIVVLPLASAVAIGGLEWMDDMSKLTRFPPELLEEGNRVQQRVSGLDSGRFAIGVAADDDTALELNDEIDRRMRAAISAGELDGVRSLHGILWSETLQLRNREILDTQPDLYPRLNAAFVTEGFRPDAFRSFGDALRDRSRPPLTLDDLRRSPLADMLTPFVFPLGDRVAVVTYLQQLHDLDAVRERLADLPGVYVLDQRSFVNDVYREFRENTLQQIAVGGLLVLGILWVRYRRWRPVLAAFLPSVMVAVVLLALFAATGVRANLLHAMSLIMVMGIGVDYGVFLVDSADDREAIAATMLSLLMSCLTTVAVFGTLAISSQPALRAIGLTTGVGVLLSYLLAPVTLVALGIRGSSTDAAK